MTELRTWLCLLLLMGTAIPATAADRFEAVREYIRAELVRESAPSIAVAVVKDGKIIWEEGFGWADRERRIPATQHTSYSLASVSKPITGTGLMTLVQSGKIDLDKPANDYLGTAKLRARVGDARGATVRGLANHTSGLPLHFQDYFDDQPVRRPSMDETILHYGNLVRAPGERTQYSNLGFGVMDYIMERVSGLSYADFMRREVFLPLGMTHSAIGIAPDLEPFVAARYDRASQPLPPVDTDSRGAGSVFSSAHDLARFGMFHLREHLRDQKAILSDASINEMHRRSGGQNVYGVRNTKKGFGVGFEIDEADGDYPVVQHDGGMDGVATRMQLFPKQRLAVVVLGNSDSLLPFRVAERIVAEMLPGRQVSPPPASTPRPPFTIPASLLGTWKGTIATYAKDVPVELRFLPNGEVHAQLGDQLTTLVNTPNLENGVFTGWVGARIDTPDTRRYAYNIWLDLSVRGNVINGAATAHTDRKGVRLGSALTYWLEVSKAP